MAASLFHAGCSFFGGLAAYDHEGPLISLLARLL
jgi:hypothetical protein